MNLIQLVFIYLICMLQFQSIRSKLLRNLAVDNNNSSLVSSSVIFPLSSESYHHFTALEKASCLIDRQFCSRRAHCNDIRRYQGWRVCFDNFNLTNCLVYSVGIANEYQFDIDMGKLGCEVHTFDPTVDLPEKLGPNVFFHKIGLYGGNLNESTAANFF